MARLIDADALKEEIQRYADAEETKSIISTDGGIMSWEHRQVLQAIAVLTQACKIVDDMPTVEKAVIPVRCKDCRYCRPINRKDSLENTFIEECVWCIEQQTGKLPDDYCSDGERRCST